MTFGPITSWQIYGKKMETMTDFIFLGSKSFHDCGHEIKRQLFLGIKAMTNINSIFKSRDIALLTNVYLAKAIVFPVVVYGCESWTIKKAEGWRTDAFELWYWRRKTLESPLDSKEIKPVNPKGNQPWLFIGKNDFEIEAPILWPPDVKTWFTGKDPDAGKDLRQEENGTTEDKMVGWHHRLNGLEFEQALGVGWTLKPGVLKSMGLQRVGHDWATELNWK